MCGTIWFVLISCYYLTKYLKKTSLYLSKCSSTTILPLQEKLVQRLHFIYIVYHPRKLFPFSSIWSQAKHPNHCVTKPVIYFSVRLQQGIYTIRGICRNIAEYQQWFNQRHSEIVSKIIRLTNRWHNQWNRWFEQTKNLLCNGGS